MNGPVARLLVARAAVLDAARAVRLSASEPGADVDLPSARGAAGFVLR